MYEPDILYPLHNKGVGNFVCELDSRGKRKSFPDTERIWRPGETKSGERGVGVKECCYAYQADCAMRKGRGPINLANCRCSLESLYSISWACWTRVPFATRFHTSDRIPNTLCPLGGPIGPHRKVWRKQTIIVNHEHIGEAFRYPATVELGNDFGSQRTPCMGGAEFGADVSCVIERGW